MYEHIGRIDEQLKNIPESNPDYKKLVEERKVISTQVDSIYALVVKKRIAYIKSHPTSFQSVVDKSIVFLIRLQLVTGDSARVLFNNLAEKVRLSTSGTETDLYIKTKENKNILIGKVAPDFNTPDVKGKLIRLSDFRGKSYVLLDFWASWCVPCIKGIPHLKALYTKYKDKGFEIIGITKDESKEDWLSAIKKQDISNWYQVSSVQDLAKASQGYIDHENINEKYPTGLIPQYILIDKTGKIIGKWEGFSEENEKDQNKLFKEIFGE
jgi:peroxiredoxin